MTSNPALAVAVAQMAPTVDADVNLQVIADLTEAAATDGARLVVFPEECMLLASDVPDLEPAVAEAWPKFVAALSTLATKHDVWLIAGGYEDNSSPRPFNTIVVIDPSGAIIDSYRKLHLYDAFSYRESDYVTSGTEMPPVVMIEGVAVGLVNCYDIRFPELSRDLVTRGADALAVSAAWVAGLRKEEHWSTLLRARAIENTCWVLAASTSSEDCIGQSSIIDPLGTTRAALGPRGNGVVHHVISLDETAAVRHTVPSLANRRIISTITIEQEA